MKEGKHIVCWPAFIWGVMDGKLLDALKREEALWDHFTRREEYNPLALDKFQCFPYWMSIHRNIFEPEVSRFLV